MVLISEKIQRLAEIKYGGDINKAAAEHFRDHPEDYPLYKDETTTIVNKRAGENPDVVNGLVQYRLTLIAHRDGLDLEKPTDRVAAQEKVVPEDPDLYKRYRAANTCVWGRFP